MLVAETADMAQKWPEVVSPKHKGLEVPGVPMATLPSLHFFFFPLPANLFPAQFSRVKERSLVPHLGPVFSFTPPPPSHTHSLVLGPLLLADKGHKSHPNDEDQ